VIDYTQLRRILVTRTDHIGDLVVSTPLLKALRSQAPQAHITCLVQKPAVALAGHWADAVITPADPLPPELDLALGLSPRTSTYKVLRASQARLRIGYCYRERPLARLNAWWSLTHCWITSLQRRSKIPHEAEVVAELGQFAGLKPFPIEPEFPISAALAEWGRQQMAGRPLLHFAPRWLERGWTRQRFFEMCLQLAPLVVTIGPVEKALLPELPSLEGVEWRTDLNLSQWAALLGGASRLISTDTGAVHIAAARGTPVTVIHLPAHAALCRAQWYPWGVPARHLTHGSELEQALAQGRNRFLAPEGR
jgi:heptosyltransferase-3